MLSSTDRKSSYDIETANQLLQQLSISLDSNSSRFLKHKHVSTSKPRLKRLLKIKYSSSSSNPNFNSLSLNNICFRCKKETLIKEVPSKISIPEKEVDVKKKVAFSDFDYLLDSSKEERKNSGGKCDGVTDTLEHFSESVPSFQSVFFSRRPSIIGNNEFWLPKYSHSSESNHDVDAVGSLSLNSPKDLKFKSQKDTSDELATEIEEDSQKINDIGEFLQAIFKQAGKPEVKILKVVELVDETIAVLTEEHFFQCQKENTSYRVLEAVLLKDVRRIFVNDDCFMIVLEINHASILTEFKEFIPGLEKTEMLVSLLVFTISRLRQNFPLEEVKRLPIHLLPSCGRIKDWIQGQEEDEEILYSGIISAENISYLEHDLLDDNFMVKTNQQKQFHPVRVSLRAGHISTTCNGGCESDCRYSFCLELRNEITRIKRESHPWPNCIYISTGEDFNMTLNSSRMASLDDLLEKIYFVIQSKSENPTKELALCFVTEFYLQLFKLKGDKEVICSFPKLNLEVKDDKKDSSCIIDSQGVEAAEALDMDSLPLQNRWKLTFLSAKEKAKFLEATSEQLV